jgi:uracil-DNA glycosylase family 4
MRFPVDYDPPAVPALRRLARRIVACRRCPRLARYLDDAKVRWPDHRCKPVPGWGDPRPRIVIVGLAPGMHGANRSGRMFTFDSSGRWVYGVLHEVGLASRPESGAPGDGLRLRGVYITAAARCAPPQNKPSPAELASCRPYLDAELRFFGRARVILALGRIAHESVLRCLQLRPRDFPFSHGSEHPLPDGRILLDSYHPSRQNTQTGRLTKPMWRRVFTRACGLLRRGSV